MTGTSGAVRAVTGLAGVAMVAFGGWHLGRLDGADLRAVALWMLGAVVAHDAVFAPLTLGATVVSARVLAPRAWRPSTLAAVLLVTVTVTAVPVLGGWGTRADNPTLLDRNYVVGWLLFAGVVVGGTLLWTVVSRRRRTRPARRWS